MNYTYNAYGKVSGITVQSVNANGSGVGSAQTLLSGIATNASGQLTGWSWASGNTQVLSYDSHGQLIGYNLGNAAGAGNAVGELRIVSYDAAGRILGYTH